MDGIISHLENLKISAFSKLGVIKNDIHDVTIGPNASTVEETKNSSHEIKEKAAQERSVSSVKPSNDELLPFRQIKKEYELSRQQQVKNAVNDHMRKFEEFSVKQNETRRKQWLDQQQKFIQNLELQDKEILNQLQEYSNNRHKNNEKLVLYFQQVEENRRKSAALLEAKKHQRINLQTCLNKHITFQQTSQEIMSTMRNITDDKQRNSLHPEWAQFKNLAESMSALKTKLKSNEATQNDINLTENLVKSITQLRNNLFTKIRTIQHEKSQEIQQQQLQQQEVIQPPKPVAAETTTVANQVRSEPQDRVVSLEKYVSKSNMKWYTEIMTFYEDYVKSFAHLLTDDRLKQFRNDCKKAVNLSVNTISAVNPHHLHDKYVKLSNLLQGKSVVIGDFRTNASNQQGGIQYCTDLLAKKFVLQGDTMVSSNPESAFSFASIIVTLWNESPDFGKLILAHFFKECPFLLPFYMPKAVDQTDEEFYKTQGYKYFDGKIEKQDKYLKRMTGIMRLYFAIMISKPKQRSGGNQHNLKFGWRWYVSVLKLEPRIDITATMLHTFLETVGFEMQNVYRTQFFKLLRFMVENYLGLVKRIDNGGGPVTRLECLIQEFKENGNQFKPPKGLLPKNFW